MKNITFNSYDLQNDNIITQELKQVESTLRNLNIQKFSIRHGGKIVSTQFEPKIIEISGIVKGSSASDLEDRQDEMKKQLMSVDEKFLVVDYLTGTRRYIATCTSVDFTRNFYTIDVIDFRATFVVSNPPFGRQSASNTLTNLGLNNSFALTTTGTHSNTVNFTGTVAPYPRVKVHINSESGVDKITLTVTNDDGFVTNTVVSRNFTAGETLIIDNDEGTVQVDGVDVDFEGGFPNWTLSGNTYSVKVVGLSYNIDVKLIYYKLWL